MIPNDYDLWLERNRPVATAEPTAEQVQVAAAIGHLESAQAEITKARTALTAAGLDPAAERRITNDLSRELDRLIGVWLRD